MISDFKKQYSVSKTISIGMIPVGCTAETVKTYIQDDSRRNANVRYVKDLIDRYHREFIEESLCADRLFDNNELIDYCEAIQDGDHARSFEVIEKMARVLDEHFKRVTWPLKGKNVRMVDIITKLPDKMLFDVMLAKDDLYTTEEMDVIRSFEGFSTYFGRYFETRSLLYDFSCKKGKALHGSVAARLLNDNLPRFISNYTLFEKIREKIDFSDEKGYFTTLDSFNQVLCQAGIDEYNTIIGGVLLEDGTKIIGLNEKINLYNQQIAKSSGEKALPFFKVLYKLPLVKSVSSSFVIDAFDSEEDIVAALKSLSDKFTSEVLSSFENRLFTDPEAYEWSNINICTDAIPEFSKMVTGDWSKIETCWNLNFDKTKTTKARSKEDYTEKRRKEFKKSKRYDIDYISHILGFTPEIGFIPVDIIKAIALYFKIEIKVKILASVPYAVLERDKGVFRDDEKLAVKVYLDNLKAFERFIKMFSVEESEDDQLFSSLISEIYELFDGFNQTYNKVRNYCTKKPYSSKKIKISMNNPEFLSGWAVGSEPRRRGFILRDKDTYFLAVSPTTNIQVFQTEVTDDAFYEKMVYNQIPDAAKALPRIFFSDKYTKEYEIPSHLISIIERRRSGEALSDTEEQELIKYYISCINNRSEWSDYSFDFKPYYSSLREFFDDVNEQSYVMRFIHVSKAKIDSMVEAGELLLFRLYNRNFGEHSHGRDSAFTRYFKLLFASENKRGEYIQLKGGAEMFFRPKSIEGNVTHKKNQPINNKICRNGKKTSTFDYDLIKDRRFSEDHFMLNLCLKINPSSGDVYPYVLNQKVRDLLKEADKQNIIGINRGENNLIYLCVIDSDANILESRSLNIIDQVNYNELLEKRAEKRADERLSWSSISDIKNLKSGYIGKAINEICKLIVKYDAIVVFDNVSTSFVSSRGKIEKNVYQALQAALVQKLNYLCFKDTEDDEDGSFKNGLQLTYPYMNPNDISTQNGIVFFLSSWGISGMDPTSGYLNLLLSKYVNMKQYKEFIRKIDSMRFDETRNMFVFKVDYEKFLSWDKYPCKNVWDIYSADTRSDFYRDKRTGAMKMQTVDLSAGFIDLLCEYGVDYQNDNLIDEILKIENADFFKRFAKLFTLMVQTRNVENGETYIISPVLNRNGAFFDSRELISGYPESSDANAAYNMARKGLLLMRNLKEDTEGKSVFAISKVDWLDYAINHC